MAKRETVRMVPQMRPRAKPETKEDQPPEVIPEVVDAVEGEDADGNVDADVVSYGVWAGAESVS